MKKLITALTATALSTTSLLAQELTAEQQNDLVGIGIEFAQTVSLYDGMIQGKMIQLSMELSRDGRLDSEESAEVSAENANAILKDIAALSGDFIQARVSFVLEAKNVLTPEQKLHLLNNLHPDELLGLDEVGFLQPALFDLPLHLNRDQRKDLIKAEADLLTKEVKIERDVELVLLELEGLLMGESIDPAKVDKQVMKLAKLAADSIENRVDYLLKAKDVLTLDQKRLLTYLMGL